MFNATAGLRRAKPDSPDHAALVAIVQEEAKRLRDIVSDLLEFATPRSPMLSSAPFADVVRGAVDMARTVVGSTLEETVLTLDPEVGQVECDERLVRQAVVNLVTNALQTVGRLSAVRVEVAHEAETLEVRVSDDGDGVPVELRDRIFTPFFSTRPKGTGLRLAVVRRCAEAHGGEIVLRETEGGGATFALQLPRRPARA